MLHKYAYAFLTEIFDMSRLTECVFLHIGMRFKHFLSYLFRLLVKFPELNYQLKIKVCIDK